MTVASSSDTTSRRGRGPILIVIVLVVAGIATAAWGIAARERAMTDLSRETREAAVTTVAVTTPSRGPAAQEISLPGNIQPFTDAAIFARTTGYLKKRDADIGSHVKAGQVLAEIDTPEIDQQLLQAKADLATAQANSNLAKTTADRYQDLIKSDSVSRQDLDNAVGAYEAKKAEVLSADANVKRLEQMQGFKTIYAPFEGVITARNIDIGALIASGSGAKELFHIAQTRRLRVFVDVPQLYALAAKPGVKADVEIQGLAGRRFPGTLSRTSQSINQDSRTLLTEIDLDNPQGAILPGSFAQVHFKLPADATTFRLPVDTLIFRSEGLRVAVVKDNIVSMVPITLGRDFGSSVEVSSGLSGTESIVVNPPDSLANGQRVVVAPSAKKSQP
jgi:RND family efflux transporter MFP subunit